MTSLGDGSTSNSDSHRDDSSSYTDDDRRTRAPALGRISPTDLAQLKASFRLVLKTPLGCNGADVREEAGQQRVRGRGRLWLPAAKNIILTPQFLPPGYSALSCFLLLWFSSTCRNPEVGGGDNSLGS